MEPENTAANNDTNVQPQQETQQAEQAKQTPEPGTMLGGEPKPAPAGAPEAYDFSGTIPEGTQVDEALTKDFTEMARTMNLTNEQANKMAAFGFQYGQKVAEAAKAQFEAEVTRWGEEAKQELGANLEKTMQVAGAGIEAIEKVIPNIRKALNETGAGNRIEVIKAFELVGQMVQADPGKLINAGTAAPAPTQTKSWYDHSNMS